MTPCAAKPTSSLAVLAVASLTTMLLTGCLSPRVTVASAPLSLTASFSATGPAPIPERWWTAFGDPALDRLVDEALAGNPGVLAAWERLHQAEASTRQQQAAYLPSLNGTGSASRTRTEAGPAVTYSSRYSLGLAASYELDFWGGVYARVEAQKRAAQATACDLRTAAETLAGEVADAWFQLLILRASTAASLRLLDTNARQLKVLEQRYDLGRAAAADVVQQRRLVASTEAALVALKGDLRVQEIRLAVLCGKVPSAASLPAGDALPSPPAFPTTGVPADVLLRRPDATAALLRLQAADWSYAAALTDRLPRLTLSASASSAASQLGDLFRDGVATMAGELVGPLLDGGQRRAQATKARATADEAYWAFVSVLLTALSDVETAIAREQQDVAYLDKQKTQLALARQGEDLLRVRYLTGTETFTAYLQAVLVAQQLELDVIRTQGAQLQHRVALCRALGGAFPLQAPTPLPARVDHFLVGTSGLRPVKTDSPLPASTDPETQP